MTTAVQCLWAELLEEGEEFLDQFPSLTTELLKLTAVAFNVRCKRTSRKARDDPQKKLEEIAAYFDDGQNHRDVLKTMEKKLNEGAFIHRKAKGEDEATIYAIGMLLPGSPAFPIEAYTAIDGLAYHLPDTPGIEVPSVLDIRTNPAARDRLLEDHGKTKVESMVMVARLAEARVRKAQQQLGEIGSGDDDEDASKEDKQKRKAAKEKLKKEVAFGPDAGAIQRFDLNPHLLRGNHETVKDLGNPALHMSAKKHMVASWSKADISGLANAITELVTTNEDHQLHQRHFFDGQRFMSFLGSERRLGDMAKDDEKVRDVKIDLTDSDGSMTIDQSTAFRLSALALAQSAIDASLLFDTIPSGVKRELAVADPELAKRVKLELSAIPDKEIPKMLFGLQDKVKQLMKVVADLEERLESSKASSGSSDAEFTASDTEGSEGN